MKLFIAVCVILATAVAYEKSDIISARIESCKGCSLNRLPQVKKFVMEDAPLYDRIDVKFISGAPPELVFLGQGDKELERLPLSKLTREDCNELLESKGFTKTSPKGDL